MARRGSIPPLTRQRDGDAFRYRAYSRVSSLEMERHRLEMERRGLERRLATLHRRRDRIDAEKADLLAALARREAAEANAEAGTAAGTNNRPDRHPSTTAAGDRLSLEY